MMSLHWSWIIVAFYLGMACAYALVFLFGWARENTTGESS